MKNIYQKIILVLSVLLLSIGFSACTNPGKNTGIGAAAGTAVGAGLGAIIGSATGDAGRGVAIGAGSGAVIGGMIGNSLDQQDQQREAQELTLAQQQAQIEENARLIRELRARGADVRDSDRGVVINLPDILFEFDRADLTSGAYRTLSGIGDVIRDVNDRPIAVEGHTDSTGDVVYNQRLSERRARGVASELERQGISRQQMSVIGYGEGRPIATNNSYAGRARNRRVEIIVENR